MARTTRSQAKKQKEAKVNSITRKFKQLSPTKKSKVNKHIAKLQKSFKDKKKAMKKKLAKRRTQKRKYGKYLRTYLDLEKVINPGVAHQIILLAKDLESQENKKNRAIQKTERDINRVSTQLDQLNSDIINQQASIHQFRSPTWRTNNLSPEILQHFDNTTTVQSHISELEEENNKLQQRKIAKEKTLLDLQQKMQELTK